MKKIMKKSIRVIVVALTAFIALCLCANSFDYREQKVGVLNYVTIELELDKQTDELLSVDNLCSQVGATCSSTSEGETVCYEIMYAVAYSDHADVERFDAKRTKTKTDFFTVTYSVTCKNPVVASYNESALDAGYAESDKRVYDDNALISAIMNGVYDAQGNCLVEPWASVTGKQFDELFTSVKYGMSTPKWYAGSDATEQTTGGVKYLVWDGSDETITYSYKVPNATGWSVTIGVLAILTVVVLFIVSKGKKDKAAFADYRNGETYETGVLLDEATDEKKEEKAETLTELPPDGYAGNGVFTENGKTVDVFGNESYSAPVPDEKKTTGNGGGNDLPDIFG